MILSAARLARPLISSTALPIEAENPFAAACAASLLLLGSLPAQAQQKARIEWKTFRSPAMEGNAEGNATVQAAIDGLIDQTQTIQRVIASLDLGTIELEGSDSLDNPGAVFQ